MLYILVASSGENLKLAQKIKSIAIELAITTRMVSMPELELPLYTSEEEEKGIPAQAILLAESMKHAQAYFFVGPEYNGGVPPVFSNTLAWLSRAGGQDWRSLFNGKFAALASVSGGSAEKYLLAARQQLGHLGTTVLARAITQTKTKPFNQELARQLLLQLKPFCS